MGVTKVVNPCGVCPELCCALLCDYVVVIVCVKTRAHTGMCTSKLSEFQGAVRTRTGRTGIAMISACWERSRNAISVV
ncbi:hypothetical protein M419DRAFT_129157 [Trichoderma reesei RUT C-30]|uniref:Uncharacterized protein n=1 Tax=Hypocrea jecorina (strain ATCC 56765 / BCRC 32924 / NRRL 11460 / Rut C-30) TaxID=1344414 RepID=A0A024SCC8_HYPJR|nr:hypothetical protein M419DRAFT_129157 [Trichoderma reesei RUT C-30]